MIDDATARQLAQALQDLTQEMRTQRDQSEDERAAIKELIDVNEELKESIRSLTEQLASEQQGVEP